MICINVKSTATRVKDVPGSTDMHFLADSVFYALTLPRVSIAIYEERLEKILAMTISKLNHAYNDYSKEYGTAFNVLVKMRS